MAEGHFKDSVTESLFSGRGKEADSPGFSSVYWNCVKKKIFVSRKDRVGDC